MVVTIKLTEPSIDEVIRKIIPTNQSVCPVVAMTDNGAYDVQPEFAAPPGTKKLANITTPPKKNDQ